MKSISIAAALLLAFAASDSPARAEGTGMFGTMPLETTDGAEIYRRICQGCHMPDGQGAVGAGRYPALANNPALGSWNYMAITILQGRRNMPAFGVNYGASFFFAPPSLRDAQVAAVINYVRTHFGNHYRDSITTADVEALHRSR